MVLNGFSLQICTVGTMLVSLVQICLVEIGVKFVYLPRKMQTYILSSIKILPITHMPTIAFMGLFPIRHIFSTTYMSLLPTYMAQLPTLLYGTINKKVM